MSCHSSPHDGLATFVDRITLPLRSTLITRASSLLRTAPSLALASVFFLMVFAICHFIRRAMLAGAPQTGMPSGLLGLWDYLRQKRLRLLAFGRLTFTKSTKYRILLVLL